MNWEIMLFTLLFGPFFLSEIADFFFPEQRDERIYRRTVKDVNFGRTKKSRIK